MKILVANLGSTSFKYRLFDMSTDGISTPAKQLARGGVERIGAEHCPCMVQIGDNYFRWEVAVPDHGAAIQTCIARLTDPEHGCINNPSEIAGIGLKAVHGGRFQGVYLVNEEVMEAMNEVSSVAPAHNPPYLAAMKQFATVVPNIPLVAAFETDFHKTIPEARRRYAIPKEWTDALPIRKWGFHGASHRYIAGRAAQLLGRSDARIISCHLGGSSSLCAIQGGNSVATSMGMSPQTGLPQNNRVGDIDPFCLPMVMEYLGLDLPSTLLLLSSKSGLLGLSGGVSGDIRDLQAAASDGNRDASLALEVYVEEIRRNLGGMLVALGGCDCLVFTGGIGENGTMIRQAVCEGLDELGIVLDSSRNLSTGSCEARIENPTSRTQIWVIPTNEELVVARQTLAAIRKSA